MTGNFHPNSDINKLYISRKKAGRGLKEIKTIHEKRLIAIRQHLLIKNGRNNIMRHVTECKQSSIIRVGNELLTNKNITENPDEKPKSLNKKYTAEKTKEHERNHINKKMHGYFQKKLQKHENIDIKGSQLRLRTKQMTSHFEGYLGAIQDQEIATKNLKRKRQIDSSQQPTMNNKCRLCKSSVENVNHVISSSPKMSVRYYLPLRHDVLTKYVLKAVIMKNHPDMKYRESTEYEYVIKHDDVEYWWNISIKTATKVPHNKPNIMIWDKLNVAYLNLVVQLTSTFQIKSTRKTTFMVC